MKPLKSSGNANAALNFFNKNRNLWCAAAWAHEA
jgi:hypothetical protein